MRWMAVENRQTTTTTATTTKNVEEKITDFMVSNDNETAEAGEQINFN